MDQTLFMMIHASNGFVILTHPTHGPSLWLPDPDKPWPPFLKQTDGFRDAVRQYREIYKANLLPEVKYKDVQGALLPIAAFDLDRLANQIKNVVGDSLESSKKS